MFFFPGEVTTVRVNMLIRSMGPISETDMVSGGWSIMLTIKNLYFSTFMWTDEDFKLDKDKPHNYFVLQLL